VILSALVEKVVIEEKDHVSLRLSPVTEVHGLRTIPPSVEGIHDDVFEIKFDKGTVITLTTKL
ncbi:MAG: hypothetical protein V4671_08070, partial [Armatimonadota bacterium]